MFASFILVSIKLCIIYTLIAMKRFSNLVYTGTSGASLQCRFLAPLPEILTVGRRWVLGSCTLNKHVMLMQAIPKLHGVNYCAVTTLSHWHLGLAKASIM